MRGRGIGEKDRAGGGKNGAWMMRMTMMTD